VGGRFFALDFLFRFASRQNERGKALSDGLIKNRELNFVCFSLFAFLILLMSFNKKSLIKQTSSFVSLQP